jgi:hypothetical protein
MHRLQNTIDIATPKIDCLRFVMCLLLALDFQGFFFFFAVGINSTNEAKRQAVRAFQQAIT